MSDGAGAAWKDMQQGLLIGAPHQIASGGVRAETGESLAISRGIGNPPLVRKTPTAGIKPGPQLFF